jgi:catechol 2,3-dioxygenase-like lactoylglutathione lyase family enzyme
MLDSSFPGIGHVALTVTDLQRSVAWYRQLFAPPSS